MIYMTIYPMYMTNLTNVYDYLYDVCETEYMSIVYMTTCLVNMYSVHDYMSSVHV